MAIVTQVGSREARERWRDLLDTAVKGDADTVIERNGKPVAALIPFELYEALLDEIDNLRAARRAAALYEEYKRDPSTARSWEEVRAELLAEGLPDEE